MIKTKTKEQLEDLCLDLLSKTYIELGQHNVDAETKVIMAQSLAEDLIWDARSKFDAGADPKTLPYYRPEPKLLT